MSATRDQSQAPTFHYTSFFDLYRKSKLESFAREELAKGVLLKSRSHTEIPASASVRVISPEQQQSLHHWTQSNLRTSYRSLSESRKRLKYLMSEVQEILEKS